MLRPEMEWANEDTARLLDALDEGPHDFVAEMVIGARI